jgi:hypothetical protein
VRLAKRGLLTGGTAQAFTFCSSAIDLCISGAFLGVVVAGPRCPPNVPACAQRVRAGTGPALIHFHLGTALVPQRRKIEEKSTRRKIPRAWLCQALLAGAAAAGCERERERVCVCVGWIRTRSFRTCLAQQLRIKGLKRNRRISLPLSSPHTKSIAGSYHFPIQNDTQSSLASHCLTHRTCSNTPLPTIFSNQLCSSHNTHRGSKHSAPAFLAAH